MKREFTATVYIFFQNKVLLHHHKKLGKWLPPGGHLEAHETPPEAARREVLEETGLQISFIEQENLKIDASNAISIERPFLCLLETIPSFQQIESHQHIDFIYLAKPLKMEEPFPPFRWFSYEELQYLDLFPDTAEVLRLVLHEKKITTDGAVFPVQAEADLACPSDKRALLDGTL